MEVMRLGSCCHSQDREECMYSTEDNFLLQVILIKRDNSSGITVAEQYPFIVWKGDIQYTGSKE